MFCSKKGGNFQTGEEGWVPLFPVSKGAGVITTLVLSEFATLYYTSLLGHSVVRWLSATALSGS